jgi:hypothetical protein
MSDIDKKRSPRKAFSDTSSIEKIIEIFDSKINNVELSPIISYSEENHNPEVDNIKFKPSEDR